MGIACGFLLAALHWSGLATLTHTPSPMAFLTKLFERPDNERPFLLLVVGYPESGTQVPDIRKIVDEELDVDFTSPESRRATDSGPRLSVPHDRAGAEPLEPAVRSTVR